MKYRWPAIRRWLHAASTACFVAGVAVLLWPAVLTAVTNYETGRIQTEALAAWDQESAHSPSAPSSLMVLEIPALALRRVVPEGATVQNLKRYGVGHISWTALPPAAAGQEILPISLPGGPPRTDVQETKTVGIAGHRTTYGAPFFRLGELNIGDSIVLTYSGRRYLYRVDRRLTAQPSDSDVLEGETNEIALVTCTPPLSAAYRLVVFGRLDSITPLTPGQ
ncbi:MAG TPA: class E sortase [bacterium]|nr:class E sortase [bacterium]